MVSETEVMNKAQQVSSLFRSQAEMARVLGRDPAIVTRMIHAGTVPWYFNSVLMEWARLNDVEDYMVQWLEPTCPCCGKG